MSKRFKFKLLAGEHAQEEPIPGQFDGSGNPVIGLRKYRAGSPGHDVIETDTDLCERFNPPPPCDPAFIKFERIIEEGRPAPMNSPITAEEAAARGFDPSYAQWLEEKRRNEAVAGSPGGQSLAAVQEAAKKGFDTVHAEQPKPSTTASTGASVSTPMPPIPPQGQSAPAASIQKPANEQPAATSQKEYFLRLDRMSVAELKAHAEEEEIDLKGTVKQHDMVRIIKAAMSG